MESGVCTLFVKLVKISKEMDFLSISIKVEIFNSPNISLDKILSLILLSTSCSSILYIIFSTMGLVSFEKYFLSSTFGKAKQKFLKSFHFINK